MKFLIAVVLMAVSICTIFADGIILADGKLEGKLAGAGSFAAAPEMDNAKALSWINMEKGSIIKIDPALTDWSNFDALELKIYSPQVENQMIMLAIYSDPENKNNPGHYYFTKINVDWQGWKTLTFPLKKLIVSRNPAGFNKIDNICLYSKGWGIEPKAGMKLAIASMVLTSGQTAGTATTAAPAATAVVAAAEVPAVSAAAGIILDNGILAGKSIGKINFVSGQNADSKAIEWLGEKVNIMLEPDLKDWSKFDAVEIKIYSQRANGEQMCIVLNSEPANSAEKGNYYRAVISLNFEGWKTIRLPLNKFIVARKPAGLNQIDRIDFIGKGWGIEPKPGMKILIESIKLVSSNVNVAIKPANLLWWNIGEGIICPFWDGTLGELAAWKQTGAGRAEQFWDSVSLYPEKGLTLTRKIDLPVNGFDRLRVALAGSKGDTFILTANTDKGDISREFVAPGSQQHEFELPLDGAKKITGLKLDFPAGKHNFAYLRYIGIVDSENLARYRDFLKRRQNLNFAQFVNEDAPSFSPAMGLFCSSAELERIRAGIPAGELETMKARVATLKNDPAPETLYRDYTICERRYGRDFEMAQGTATCLPYIWYGVLFKDEALLKIGVKRAFAIAMSPRWGGGAINYTPGTSWDPRAFWDAMTVEELVFALDFAGEMFTQAGKDYILRQIAERGLGAINYTVWRYDYIFGCNQLAAFSPGRVLAYLALEKSGWKHVTPYTDLAIAELNENMNRIFYEDGGFPEGAAYFQYTAHTALPPYYLYARARGKNYREILPKCMDNLSKYIEVFASTDKSEALMPVSSSNGKHGPNAQPLAMLAAIFPKSQYVTVYNKLKPDRARVYWEIIAAGNVPKEVVKPENFTILPSIASAASVRELDGKTLKIFFTAHNLNLGHKHQDAGMFLIELDGETFAMDSGSVSYANPNHRPMILEDRHNTFGAVKNGEIIKQRRATVQPSFNAAGGSKAFEASTDLSKVMASSFAVLKRELKSDSPEQLTIRDTYEITDDAVPCFYWLTTLPITVEKNIATITGTNYVAKFDIPNGWTPKIETFTRDENQTSQNRLTLTGSKKSGTLELKVKFMKK